MRGRLRQYALGGLVLLSAILAVWLQRAHRPFEYMVAGTLVTAILLLGAFLLVIKRGVM